MPNVDPLLEALRREYGKPRYDIPPELLGADHAKCRGTQRA
jgi:hypothetical protein